MEILFRPADFVSMFSVVFTVYVAVIIFFIYKKNYLKKSDYEKRKYSYEFCLKMHNELNKLSLEIKDIPLRQKNARIDVHARRIIEIFNEISIGVNHALLDEEIVRPMFEGIFISFFKENKYLMFTAGDELNNPYLFNEFQTLTEKWQREPMQKMRFSK